MQKDERGTGERIGKTRGSASLPNGTWRDGRRGTVGHGALPTTGGRGRPQKPAFCETKPFVMLRKTHLYGSERKSCADYRKMTNGFVFGGRRGRSRVWSLCSLRIEAVQFVMLIPIALPCGPLNDARRSRRYPCTSA